MSWPSRSQSVARMTRSHALSAVAIALSRQDPSESVAERCTQIPCLAGLFRDDQGRHAPPPYAIPCDSLPRIREHPEDMQGAGVARAVMTRAGRRRGVAFPVRPSDEPVVSNGLGLLEWPKL